MKYFDDINWLNLDYFFNLFYTIFFGIPKLIIDSIMFWFNFIGSGGNTFSKILFSAVAIFCGWVTFYSLFKIWQLYELEKAAYAAIFAIDTPENEEKKRINEEWVDIMSHMENMNPSNWVLAIIECDKIMDMLLRERGFVGKDLGEMLKSDKGKSLKTIQDAWEAHKIRNKIAHEAGHVLERREAMLAVARYESVFKELGFLE